MASFTALDCIGPNSISMTKGLCVTLVITPIERVCWMDFCLISWASKEIVWMMGGSVTTPDSAASNLLGAVTHKFAAGEIFPWMLVGESNRERE